MANPQKENGFTPIANELLEAFYRCKLLEYERIIVMCIWRKTYGWQKKEDWISNSQFNEDTGLARPHITRTIKSLRERKILTKNVKKLTINKNYDEWLVEWRVTSPGNRVTSPGNKKLPHQVPTKEKKETITKDTCRQGSARIKNTMQNENLIPEVIKAMESVDPKNKTYYGNKTQRAACQFLIDEYGLEQVLQRITYLPKTNTMPFFPNITTPCQLRDKWMQLQNAVARHKQEAENNNKVAF